MNIGILCSRDASGLQTELKRERQEAAGREQQCRAVLAHARQEEKEANQVSAWLPQMSIFADIDADLVHRVCEAP